MKVRPGARREQVPSSSDYEVFGRMPREMSFEQTWVALGSDWTDSRKRLRQMGFDRMRQLVVASTHSDLFLAN